MRLIDADKLEYELGCSDEEIIFKEILREAPTVDAYTEQDLRDVFNDGYSVGMEQAVRHGHNKNREYHEADEFRCSECGLHLEDWTRYVYDEDSDEEYAQEYVFKHCPECGAKIGGQ